MKEKEKTMTLEYTVPERQVESIKRLVEKRLGKPLTYGEFARELIQAGVCHELLLARAKPSSGKEETVHGPQET
ncbi:hypothetical protein [Schleiferilactobacillus harbinensis]|uniref:hypothetical protein n=1 Tax=Schleiferilactobacillus harbinensis TaxID=304207 RepID=UPI00345E35F6